ncbi:MAG: 3-dehydroquinate synthase [Pyrinomonadaceae bacterium]
MRPDHSLEIKLSNREHSYRVEIGHNLLEEISEWAGRTLSPAPRKIALVSNTKVFEHYGRSAVENLRSGGFEVSPYLMQDGEEFKNFDSFRGVLRFFGENNLSRADCVVAIGGGVVGDLAGFSASVYLRGMRFLQIPTTLLSMVDSSVGGKTGINDDTGKNLIGAFHQPNGVMIDLSTLRTLDSRELAAGFCEMIKHGVLAGEPLFSETADFLKRYQIGFFSKAFETEEFRADLASLVHANVNFKSQIVAGDEFEEAARTDPRSRKILNFGHTVAHALEKTTNYTYFKHGEAVAYGMLAAAEISKELDICDHNSLKSFNDVVTSLGRLPEANHIDIEKVVEAFTFDKKNIGQSLHWILLESIGQPKIVKGNTIPRSVIEKSLRKILA